MRKLGWILSVVSSVAFAIPAFADDCALKQIASLDMLDGYPGRVVVQISINDTPRKFIIDTGSPYSELFDDVVKELDLTTGPIDSSIELYDVAGKVSKKYVMVPHLKVGPVKGDNLAMVVMPRRSDNEGDIAGILGPDILARFDLDFDFAGKKFNLISTEHCEGKVVYWTSSYSDVDFRISLGNIYLPMTLDGKEIKAVLDTGSPDTLLSDGTGRRKFNLEENSPGMEPVANATDADLVQFSYRFKSLSVGGLAVSNPLILILKDRAQESFDKRHLDKIDLDPIYADKLETQDLILGMNVLQKLHLYIAYKEHKIYVTGADAH
ncbi:MAG: aspartyl protease family protein [Proteobacteria bacterium]|nr:aspartyl protease family protein [Pseudomonadota bacterium]